MTPGDVVVYRGAKVELLSLPSADTPSGGKVELAYVKRPRAGATLVFRHEIEPLPREPEPNRALFR